MLAWKWTRGQSTDVQDFGDPVAGIRYALCTYDQADGVSNLVVDSVIAPIDNSCTGRLCWNRTSSGFNYVSPDRSLKLKLKRGVDGKAAVFANGKRVDIRSTAPQIVGLLLRQDSVVTIQLINDMANGVCWESVYAAPARKNDNVRFLDSAP